MLKIVFSNIRKYKSSMITLSVLILLASMLLTIGFTMAFEMDSFYLDKVNELNAPHLSYYVNSPEVDRVITKAADFDGVKKIEATKTILCNGVVERSNEKDIAAQFYVQNAEQKQEIASLRLIDESSGKKPNAVAMPLVFRDTYGIKTDDTFNFTLNGQTYTYTVYGFFEEILYGSPMMGYYKLFLYDDAYNALLEGLPAAIGEGMMINVQMENHDQIKAMTEHLSGLLDTLETAVPYLGLDMDAGKMAIVTPINIFAMVLIGFSFIVVIVAMIVVGFSISTAVEDGIQSIGILKALGHKNGQIIMSLVWQYGALVVISSVIGVLIAMICLPVVGDLAATLVGVKWSLAPNIWAVILSLLLVIGLVVLVVVFKAGKTKKITPIMALRNGVETHNFKRNPFPLSDFSGNVNVGIALKSVFGNIKQNLAVTIIVISVTFAAVFSLVLYDNFVLNDNMLKKMLGMTLSSVMFNSSESEQVNKKVFDEIAQMDGVTGVARLEQMLIKLEGFEITGLYVSDDFKNVNKDTIYEGRMPINDNEIAISNLISDKIGKGIGDIMPFTLKGITEEFLITGLTEQMSQLGCVIDIDESGYRRFDPNYRVRGITIDLEEDVDIEAFIAELESKYADMGKTIMNVKMAMSDSLSSMVGGITALVVAIITIMALVVALVLFMIIKMRIMRDRTNIGISKAIGFTSWQLILQISGSLACIIGVGTILGGIVGGLCTNSVLSLLLRSIGIWNANFNVNYLFVACLAAGITILAFVISGLVSLRIKRITPYNLLVE